MCIKHDWFIQSEKLNFGRIEKYVLNHLLKKKRSLFTQIFFEIDLIKKNILTIRRKTVKYINCIFYAEALLRVAELKKLFIVFKKFNKPLSCKRSEEYPRCEICPNIYLYFLFLLFSLINK